MGKGYMRLGKVGGTTMRMHWSAPIAVVLWSVAFGANGRWIEVGAAVVAIYLAHGLGHWLVARGHKFQVHGLDLGPLGVYASYSGQGPRSAHTWVAFGGVMAHMLIGMACAVMPSSGPVWQAAVGVNVVLGAVNLVPAGTLDGAKGWPLAMGAAQWSPPASSRHPAAQRARWVREVDQGVGHPPSSRPAARGRKAKRESSSSEVDVPPEVVKLADQLMMQARRDARQRVADADSAAGGEE